MSGPGRTAVVYNPLAGGGRGEAVARRVAERLAPHGAEVRTLATLDRRGAYPLARDVAGEVDRIVAIGGDGTLREVLDGLGPERARVEVGVVPMGNANVVAREVGIPTDADAAIDVLVGGETVELDLGALTIRGATEIFLAVVGVGWDAETVSLLDRTRHTALGRRAYRVWADGLYGVAGLATALRPAQARFTVEADDTLLERSYRAAYFCNLRTYGKGMAVTPEAHGASGRIHAHLRKSALLPLLLWQLGAALRGRRAPAFVSDYVDGVRFVMRAERPFAVQVDGDDRGRVDTVEVGVLPAAARLIAPRPSLPRARRSRAA